MSVDYVCPFDLMPEDEAERMQVLRECQILDTPRDDTDFDRYTSLACRIFKAPNCQVSLVDAHRAWPKSHFGVGTPVENPRHHSICYNVVLPTTENVFVINDCSLDERVKHIPAVKDGGLRFYAGGVIIVDNRKIGSFCILDFVPREFNLIDKLNLMEIAAAVSQIIASRRALYLQQEFLKMLLHNLRTPLTSLNFSVSILTQEKEKVTEDVSSVVEEIRNAVKSLNFTVEKSLIEHPNKIVSENIAAFKSASDETIESMVSRESTELESYSISNSINNSSGSDSSAIYVDISSNSSVVESSDGVDITSPAIVIEPVESADNTTATIIPAIHTPKAPRGNGHDVVSLPLKTEFSVDKIRVLLIEDSVMIQKVMRKWLESYGCEVHSALHGLQGLNKLKTEQFDIVITDFLMPVMDGLECLQQYSEHLSNTTTHHNRNNNMLIIGMSATADNNEIQRAFLYGMHCFSAKPVDLKLLERCIELKKRNSNLSECVNAMLQNHNSKSADSPPNTATAENETSDLTARVNADVRTKPRPNSGNSERTTDGMNSVNNTTLIPRKSSYSFIGRWLFPAVKIVPVTSCC